MDMVWCEDTETATIDTKMKLKWNPTWFSQLPVETRKTVLIHEIEHVAKLHFIRGQGLDPKLWGQATDHEINLGLEEEGYSFAGTEPLKDPRFRGLAAEEIYEILKKESDSPNKPQPNPKGEPSAFGPSPSGETCMQQSEEDSSGSEPSIDELQQDLNNMLNEVIKADQVAKMSDKYTESKSKAMQQMLDQFLKSKMDWFTILRKYFNQKLKKAPNWKRPNRRHQDIFLPSRKRIDGKLSHASFYLDTSGSVSDEMVKRFFSEVRHVKQTYNPDLLTISQFDTDIHSTVTYTSHQSIKLVNVIGRGGTDLQCVHDHILETKPTIVVILSDLECRPMQVIPKLDVVWICMENPTATVNQGKLIHVQG